MQTEHLPISEIGNNAKTSIKSQLRALNKTLSGPAWNAPTVPTYIAGPCIDSNVRPSDNVLCISTESKHVRRSFTSTNCFWGGLLLFFLLFSRIPVARFQTFLPYFPSLFFPYFPSLSQTLGVDSEFCLVESFVTGMVDKWPKVLLPQRRRFTFAVCLLLFILGIPMVTHVSIFSSRFSLQSILYVSGGLWVRFLCARREVAWIR